MKQKAALILVYIYTKITLIIDKHKKFLIKYVI